MSEQFTLALVITLANGVMLLIIHRFNAALHGTRILLVETQDLLAKTTNELVESENRFKVLFENPQVGVYFLTLQGNILMCNSYGSGLLGYSMEEFLALHPHDTTHPDDQVISNQLFMELRVGKRDSYQLEKRHIHKNGHVVWVDLNVWLVRNDAGDPFYCVASAKNITQRKHAEKKLKEAEQVYRQAIAVAGGVPYHLDLLNKRLLFMGEGAEELTGYMPDELSVSKLMQMRQESVFWGELQATSLQEAASKMLSSEVQFWTVDHRFHTRRNEERWISDSAVLVRDENGLLTHSIGFWQDITWRKRLEKKLLQAKDAAEAANQSKSRFVANTSHELRNPMNAVIGMTDLLLLTPLNWEQKGYIQTIRNSAGLLLTILNDILDHAKMESGKLDVTIEPFVLSTCVQEVANLFLAKAAEKQLLLTTILDPELPPVVASDSVRLRQILGNLLSNALKFTETGEISLSVASKWQEDAHFLHFTVQDTGIGIPEEAIDRLFEAFEQVDSSTTRLYGGTGLGLSISKQLVELLGGNIRVESQPGKGSTFHFTIEADPVSKLAVSPTPDLALTPAIVDESNPLPLRILLAEDNPANQKVTIHMLNRLGYRADLAVTGKEVLNALAQSRYDLILMDIEMPQLDGVETTRAIRTQFSLEWQPYIIALTGHVSDGSHEYFLEVGMDDYISKPVMMKDLAAALQRVQLPAYAMPRGNDRNGKYHDLLDYDLRVEVRG